MKSNTSSENAQRAELPHTPGEWKVGRNPNKDATIYCGTETIISRIKNEANAQRIVKAVNMHDELIEVLKNAKKYGAGGLKEDSEKIDRLLQQAESK